MAKYEWIVTEKQYFGQANTAYDFTNSDPKDVARRLGKLQENKEKLSKNVNMRAMNMFSKAEEKVGYILSLFCQMLLQAPKHGYVIIFVG